MAPESRAHGSEAPKRQVALVRAGDVAEDEGGVFDSPEQFFGAGGDDPDHEVRMAGDVFGAGLDRDVHPVVERLEKKRRRPCVVEQHRNSPCVRRRRDRRDVLHLEGQRSRGFAENQPGFGPDQTGDRIPDQGIVIGGVDPEARQQIVAEIPCRTVDRIDHQDMISLADKRREGHRDGGKPRSGHHRARAALQIRNGIGQREGGGRAVGAVPHPPVFPLAVRPAVKRRHRRRQNSRGPVDRHVDDPAVMVGIFSRVYEPRVVFHGVSFTFLRSQCFNRTFG